MNKPFCYRLLIMAATLCLNHVSFSQFALGAKGGISIPNLSSGSTDNPLSSGWSSRKGPYFGAVATYGLSDHLAIQAELNYASQGGKKDGVQAIPGAAFTQYFQAIQQPVPNYVYANYKSEAKLNYLELPVMLKWTVPIGEQFSFFINAGPYAGFLLNAKQVVSGESDIYADAGLTQPYPGLHQSFDTTVDIKSDIHTFNAGIQAGIGFSLNIGSGSLFITGGGNYGFVNIQKDEANGKNNTGAATVTIGYLFDLERGF